MRPKPFMPERLADGTPYVRDTTDGRVWHFCGNRTLYADTDRSQVVYHANYLKYFEMGRAELMRTAAYPYREIEESGYVYPIIQVGVSYFSPLAYDDPMIIYTRPGALERVKLQFDYVITHDGTGKAGEIVCKGFTRHCATNAGGMPVGIDRKTISLWENFPE